MGSAAAVKTMREVAPEDQKSLVKRSDVEEIIPAIIYFAVNYLIVDLYLRHV